MTLTHGQRVAADGPAAPGADGTPDGVGGPGGETLERRPTGELLGAISSDLAALVRQEIELGKLEMSEVVVARVVALAAAGAAGVLALVGLVFGALAAADALAYVVPSWAARLIVAAAFGCGVLLALPIAVRRARTPETLPAETLRTAKEDIEWAKAHLKR